MYRRIGIVTVLAVCLTIGSSPAFAQSRGTVSGSASSLKGQLIASGRVTNSHDQPVSGAQVRLFAWPTQAVVTKLKPGDRVPLRVVGSASSAADGSYAIRLASPSGLLTSSSPQGVVNLEIVASHGSAGMGSFSFSRKMVQVNGHAKLVTLFGKRNPAAAVVQQTAAIRLHSNATVNAQATSSLCALDLVAVYSARPGVVGSSYSRYAGENTQWFTYGVGQSTSIGVGVSASDQYGSFSASGSYSVSSSGSQTWPTASSPISLHYLTEFRPALYKWTCNPEYQEQAYEWAAGATTTTTSPPDATYCVPENAGAKFAKSTTQAFIFSSGFSMPAGFSAHTLTGYDSTAVIHYTYITSGRLCGFNDYPGGTPARIVAGAKA